MSVGAAQGSETGTIVVVDDRIDDRTLLAIVLRHAGHTVFEAASGAEALELVRTQRPSLLISDILMPGMNGYELIRALRSDPDVAATRVAFCTAISDEPEVLELAEACGVGCVISKPWEPEQLINVVHDLLQRSEAHPRDLDNFSAVHLRVVSDKLVEKVITLERTEQELRRSQELYRLVVENTSDLISLLEPDGRVVYASPSHERVLGLSPHAMVGERWADFIELDDIPRAEAAFAEAARGGESPLMTARAYHRDGRWVVLEGVATAIHGESGELELILSTSRDVTERVRLEQELHQSQKLEAIGQLSGGVAHDFNNMLAAITGFAELLLMPGAELGERERLQIQHILAAGERAGALTQQLLAFSRRQVLQPRVIDLNTVVSEIEAMLARLIGEHIEFVTTLDPSLAPVYADANQLGQVLMNLTVNGRDAMPNGGRLTVETANVEFAAPVATPHVTVKPGSYVRLAVTDTGTGMDADTSSRLFEPFFTTKEAGEGTGLGLSTVYGIVRQTGGYVWAESEPGEGSSFTVLLPAADAMAPPSAREPEPAEVASVSGSVTVMLVEDEETTRRVIEEMLARAGYRVLVARNGEEALALFDERSREIDVVMTDVVMPKIGGPELAEALSERRPGIPVLFTSGYVVDDLVREDILSRAHFLPKPFSLDALRRKLAEVTARPSR